MAEIFISKSLMRYKKRLGAKKVVKLEGILKGHDIDLSALIALKEQTWQHVDQELENDG